MTERVVITGANRGLGLELARTYAGAGAEVWAGCRRPAEAAALIVALIDGLSVEQSGQFLRWNGTVHPW